MLDVDVDVAPAAAAEVGDVEYLTIGGVVFVFVFELAI